MVVFGCNGISIRCQWPCHALGSNFQPNSSLTLRHFCVQLDLAADRKPGDPGSGLGLGFGVELQTIVEILGQKNDITCGL